ncbi:MAG: hypothetical protein HOD63_09055 [Bacteroidetes bacterium]|nr:hypothetical protein [Bacteroidota bacterium]MBT5530322.1 hypothetical protein [Cytophagia bacterium]MBT7826139.1 hypothetical protein [Bacteroidota bacterium]MBT7993731.1 hypothetical protein [Bacteroidota bacterium]
MLINRIIKEEKLGKFKEDFGFLIDIINQSNGELDLSIRDNYFNLYYNGHNLSKIDFASNSSYRISIHRKYYEGSKANESVLFQEKEPIGKNEYYTIKLTSSELPSFFSSLNLKNLQSKIREVNHSEELSFEQSIISQYNNRKVEFIIDRQVTSQGLKGGRIDLLALKQKENSIYEFEVFEVKIGNNPDLKGAVAQQLKDYQEYILRNFKDFKFCYEKHYEQKKYLGLFSIPDYDRIKIEQPVSGRVIIGGYNEIAKKYIDNLEEQGIIVQTFNY